MDVDDDLRFEKDGPARRISLTRPEKHNALSASMQMQLHEVSSRSTAAPDPATSTSSTSSPTNGLP